MKIAAFPGRNLDRDHFFAIYFFVFVSEWEKILLTFTNLHLHVVAIQIIFIHTDHTLDLCRGGNWGNRSDDQAQGDKVVQIKAKSHHAVYH